MRFARNRHRPLTFDPQALVNSRLERAKVAWLLRARVTSPALGENAPQAMEIEKKVDRW